MYTVSPAVQDTVRCFFHKKAHLRYRTSRLGTISGISGAAEASVPEKTFGALLSAYNPVSRCGACSAKSFFRSKTEAQQSVPAARRTQLPETAAFCTRRNSILRGFPSPDYGADRLGFPNGRSQSRGTMASRTIKRFIIIENHNSKGGASWNMLLAPSLP